jgi:prophage regulatory protein
MTGHQVATVPRLIRIPSVRDMTGLSDSEIWRRISAGNFPKPHKLGPQTTVFVESEIADWVRARIAERDAASKPA